MASTARLLSFVTILVIAGASPVMAAELSSPPRTSNEASFAADQIDAEWSARTEQQIEETLHGVSSSAIECRSSMCKVTVTWPNPPGSELGDQFRQRIARWTQDVGRKGGFVQIDTNFNPNDPTTVSYLSTRRLMGRVPPGLSAESTSTFQKCLRDEAERFRQQGPADPTTSTVSTCVP